jgi:hypothetical protein
MHTAELLRPAFSYNITTGATATSGTRTTPFGVIALRFCATQDCFVTIGQPPTAASATTAMLIRASLPGEVFKCAPGDVVSAIESTAAGSLNITEMTR